MGLEVRGIETPEVFHAQVVGRVFDSDNADD
jgi:hypothetical protein